jgi:hypothetical protein
MRKHNVAVPGRISGITALLNGIIKRQLQPACGSVLLTAILHLSRSKADLVAENALLRQQITTLQRRVQQLDTLA